MMEKNIEEAWQRKCFELDNQAMVRKSVTREVGAHNLEKFRTAKDLANLEHIEQLKADKAFVTKVDQDFWTSEEKRKQIRKQLSEQNQQLVLRQLEQDKIRRQQKLVECKQLP